MKQPKVKFKLTVTRIINYILILFGLLVLYVFIAEWRGGLPVPGRSYKGSRTVEQEFARISLGRVSIPEEYSQYILSRSGVPNSFILGVRVGTYDSTESRILLISNTGNILDTYEHNRQVHQIIFDEDLGIVLVNDNIFNNPPRVVLKVNGVNKLELKETIPYKSFNPSSPSHLRKMSDIQSPNVTLHSDCAFALPGDGHCNLFWQRITVDHKSDLSFHYAVMSSIKVDESHTAMVIGGDLFIAGPK